MSVVVVATIIPLPEYRDEVIAALTGTVPRCTKRTAASCTPCIKRPTGW